MALGTLLSPLASAVGLALLAFGAPLAARTQLFPSTEVEDGLTFRCVLEGFVLGPDGGPARDALVVTSAGGKAGVDEAGRYRLELSLSPGVERIQVTAVGNGGSASTSVEILGTSGRMSVAPLTLARSVGCTPSWLPTFGGDPNAPFVVRALAVFDDGGGPALFVGGDFSNAFGGLIAKWNGRSWSSLGTGLGGVASVRALAVFDDGNGPALYAGGDFTTAGGLTANRVAKWDGATWSALGSGTNSTVSALMPYDDGNGPALYAGGSFTSAGGAAASRIAKWDGAAWSPLGGGLPNVVNALVVHDDGSGAALFAGTGQATARWDGVAWSQLGPTANTSALAVFDDGSGPALCAARGSSVAKWTGASWTALGSSFSQAILALAPFDDGGGPALYAGGSFVTADGVTVNRIARWDGAAWSSLESGVVSAGTAVVQALAVHDDGHGPALIVGGNFTGAGGTSARRIAKWDGASWSTLGKGLNGIVRCLTEYDDGNGAALYAGGEFATANGVSGGIARWDGTTWSSLGGGTDGTVTALAVYDDGTGPALFAGGTFTSAGGVPASHVAKWDGSSWSALGSGVFNQVDGNTFVQALAVFDDGAGPDLYVAGSFLLAGGSGAKAIARWDGTSWSALGSGLTEASQPFLLPVVYALAVHDDGNGPALYAGGDFQRAGGGIATYLAKWKDSAWSPVGGGMDYVVRALAVYTPPAVLARHGTGTPELFAAGLFGTAGGVIAPRIARWNASAWSDMGADPFNVPAVYALTVFDDGTGPALHAGGDFTSLGGIACNNVAKWNGSTWAPLGSGTDTANSSAVVTLAVHDDGRGAELFAGGSFLRTPDSGDSYLARWGCPGPPVLHHPASVGVFDGFPQGSEVVHFTVTATGDVEATPIVVCTPPSGSVFPVGTTLVTCTATDSEGRTSESQFPVTVYPKYRRR